MDKDNFVKLSEMIQREVDRRSSMTVEEWEEEDELLASLDLHLGCLDDGDMNGTTVGDKAKE